VTDDAFATLHGLRELGHTEPERRFFQRRIAELGA
jgi:hypothetical protein